MNEIWEERTAYLLPGRSPQEGGEKVQATTAEGLHIPSWHVHIPWRNTEGADRDQLYHSTEKERKGQASQSHRGVCYRKKSSYGNYWELLFIAIGGSCSAVAQTRDPLFGRFHLFSLFRFNFYFLSFFNIFSLSFECRDSSSATNSSSAVRIEGGGVFLCERAWFNIIHALWNLSKT